MSPPVTDVIWKSNPGALVEALAKAAGLQPRRVQLPPSSPLAEKEFELWMEAAAVHLGLESEREILHAGDLRKKLRAAAPAILRVPEGLMGLVSVKGGRAMLVLPDLSTQSVRLDELAAALREPLEAPLLPEMEAMLAGCGLYRRARGRALEAIMEERLRHSRAATVWQLRTPAGAGMVRQLGESGLMRRILLLVGAHAAEYGLWLAAWWVIGQAALQGRIDRGWMAAWVLLLATAIPLRLVATWTQGLLAVGCGGLLRQRLLAGALRLDPGEIRREGAGQLLGRTLEAEAVETLALSGGAGSVLASVEAAFALFVLASGPMGILGAGLFCLWIGLAILLTWRCYVRRRRWTEERLAMTHDLVERMSGHRTRLAQQAEENWHDGEDQALDSYLTASRAMDRETVRLTGLLPHAWLLAGIASAGPIFLADSRSPAGLALAVGGLLLGWRALFRMVNGASHLAGAWIAGRQVARLFDAASRREAPGAFAAPGGDGTIIDARDLVFQHSGRSRPVLEGASLKVRPGDWILLEGASGGGKSTLGALLAGLREPSSGVLLAGGLDLRTLGERAWRRLVAVAPQYHENHILTGTFSFNLLMARAWPPSEEDVKEARQVCQELGLSPLLERMPGGMDQMVGETGWQLSQGERSRLFLARALLQDSQMAILDESFAALDPENLRQALECALRRSKALLVVAHP